MKTMTTTEARSGWADLIEHVIKGGSMLITRNGKPKAMIGPPVDLERVRDDLETLRSATAGLRSFSGHHGGSTMADTATRLCDFADRFAAKAVAGAGQDGS